MDGFALVMLWPAAAIAVCIGLVIRCVQLLVERARGRLFTRTTGARATALWALGVALASFAGAGVMSIGMFVLPFAVIACAVAAWRCRALPEGAVGFGFGTGIVLLVVGLMNPACTWCVPGYAGVNGTSWLPLAVTLIVAASVGQTFVELRVPRAHPGAVASPER